MKTFEQASIILRLARAMRQRGSWTGETHIQKAMYFLQHLMQLPTGFEFILYKHGPFSFDLRATLTFMEAEDLVRWQSRPHPYGPTLEPGPDHSYLLRHYDDFVRVYDPQIEFIAERLGPKDVKSLERLATALYVTLEGGNRDERPVRLNALKPHVQVDEARKAIDDLDAMLPDTVNLGLKTALSTIPTR